MKLDIGFIVLCLNNNKFELKSTVDSILWSNGSHNHYGVATSSEGLDDVCTVYEGSDTITSLINIGMQKLTNEWAFILYSGSRLKTNLQRKMCSFIKSNKDVFFPIVNGRTNFVDGSSNGIMVHRDNYREVGDFPVIKKHYESTLNDFEIAKLLWANTAISRGSQFKAVAGIKIS